MSVQVIRQIPAQNVLIVILQGVKVRICGSLAGQPLAVTYKLDIAQAGGYTRLPFALKA